MKLYEHAAEQTPPPDGVAGEAIRHLHTHLLPHEARQLGNQVVCMIAEYHLMSSTRVSLTQSPILPEAAKPLQNIGHVLALSGMPPGVISGSCHSWPLIQEGRGSVPI